MSLTGSVSENMLLTIGNPNLVLYMVGLSVATKLEGEKNQQRKPNALEKVFLFSCVPLILSHIVFLTVTQCHGAVGIERSRFNQHKTSKQVLIVYIT